ncbi:hypothetical protein [Corynebacterium mustelae]|uniref:hypothetical protein n=1 Tax=Corynebacterium mustelae TaxID=571915 RepID=UPI00130EC9F6|nr:hypothetical protein [Corynebacterium mustelae]
MSLTGGSLQREKTLGFLNCILRRDNRSSAMLSYTCYRGTSHTMIDVSRAEEPTRI